MVIVLRDNKENDCRGFSKDVFVFHDFFSLLSALLFSRNLFLLNNAKINSCYEYETIENLIFYNCNEIH